MNDTVELRAGDLHLVLDPGTGGAIAALRYRDVAVLRPVADGRLGAQHGRAVAGYPLIPYANRVAGGRFSFGGQAFSLPRNFGDHPHSIHGNAWMQPWTMAEAGKRTVALTLENAASDSHWPFAYRARQVFDITERSVTISMFLENTDARAFPAGMGLHPYVARTPKAKLRFEADSIWTSSPDGLPIVREAVHGGQEFDVSRALGTTEIDSCYAGWGGAATVVLPEYGLTIVVEAGPPMDHLQVYTPAGRDYLGLEPVSNMPDAINRMDVDGDQGMVVLAPGGVLSARVTLSVLGS